MLYSVLNSKQKQFTGHISNKMRESTLSWIGNFEEKIDLSRIYLAVVSRQIFLFFFSNFTKEIDFSVTVCCCVLNLVICDDRRQYAKFLSPFIMNGLTECS